MTPNVRRAAGSAAALLAALALSSCSSDLSPDLHPGDAVVVEGEAISLDAVDDLARDMCALEKAALAQRGTVVPMAFVRSYAAEVLTTEVLLRAFGEQHDIDMDKLRTAMVRRAEAQLKGVPAGLRDAAERQVVVQHMSGFVFQAAGRQPGDTRATPPGQQLARGSQLFEAWRDGVEVDRDPRLGAVDLDSGQWSGATGSLSVAVERAPDEQLDASEVPAAQLCGEVPAAGQPGQPGQAQG